MIDTQYVCKRVERIKAIERDYAGPKANIYIAYEIGLMDGYNEESYIKQAIDTETYMCVRDLLEYTFEKLVK